MRCVIHVPEPALPQHHLAAACCYNLLLYFQPHTPREGTMLPGEKEEICLCILKDLKPGRQTCSSANSTSLAPLWGMHCSSIHTDGGAASHLHCLPPTAWGGEEAPTSGGTLPGAAPAGLHFWGRVG